VSVDNDLISIERYPIWNLYTDEISMKVFWNKHLTIDVFKEEEMDGMNSMNKYN
jgi:hypothetical protein